MVMALADFYRGYAWEKFLVVLKSERANEKGYIVCEKCHKEILRAYDCIGHHKIELTEENYTDASISLNPDNVQLLCHACHNRHHQNFGNPTRHVFIVYGSPLSGKTSFVAETMSPGDVVVDIDNIWQCVSGLPRYQKPNRLKSVVFAVRDSLYESVRYRRGKWINAFIIGSFPFEAERNRLASELGARLIHIDTDRATCIERLENDTERNHEEWQKYIDDYWLQFSGGY